MSSVSLSQCPYCRNVQNRVGRESAPECCMFLVRSRHDNLAASSCAGFLLYHTTLYTSGTLWPSCSNSMKDFSSLVSTGSVSQAQTCLHKLEHGCHVMTLLDHDFAAEYWINTFNSAMILEEDGGRYYWSSLFYVGDAGNTSLVELALLWARPRSLPQGVLVIYFGSAASWRPCNVVWPHQDLFPTAEGCKESRLPNVTLLHWAQQRYALVGCDGWVIGRLVGQGLHHQSYHT